MARNGEVERVALLAQTGFREDSGRAGAGSTRTSYEVEAATRPIHKLEQANFVQKLRRILTAFVFFCLAVAAVTLVYFGEKKIRLQYGRYDYCMDPACIHASSAILKNLSPKKVDPCENFDEFVCGGWADTHDLRPDQGDIFEGTMMAERSQQVLRHVLEGTYEDLRFAGMSKAEVAALTTAEEDKVDRANFEKLQNAYKACLDEKEIDARGIKPLEPILEKLEAIFKDDKTYLTDAITYISEIGATALVGFSIGADDRNPDSIVMSVSNPRKIGLPSKQYYKDEKIAPAYIGTIDQMFKKVEGALTAKHERNATKVVEFEKKLSDATMDPEDQNDITKTYNPFSLKEVSEMLPQFDFEHFFKAYTPSHVPQRLIVGSPDYLKAASKIVKDTEPAVIKSYIEWKLIQELYRELPKSVSQPVKDLLNKIKGTQAEEERWHTCVKEMDAQLGWFLGRFFIQKAFSEAAKVLGDRIIMDIKEQFTYTLNHLDWISNDVRKLATEKVHNIIQKVGYPDGKGLNITDPAALQKFYSDIEITPNKYFENTVSVRKHELAREWKKLGKPTDRNEWYMTPPTVNAYYSPAGNEIVFPAGIMQFPVFGDVLPEYLSYGAFGSVAGHELSHAFDSLGRHYDLHGNYTDWWDEATVNAFEKKADCFVHQFEEYSVEGPDGKPLHVNGKLTLGENIADAGGVNAAFAAWQKREKQNPNPHLPGLDKFTKEQLFFVSYGSWWCSKSRKEAAINRIRLDPHSPKFARILGTMANAPAFLESFQCPVKKPRCKLW